MNYYLSPDGELYHFGWKKKDVKYIKRERKNGKWVYTYKDGSTGSGGVKVTDKTKAKDKTVTYDVDRIFSKSHTSKNSDGSTSTIRMRGALERTIDKVRDNIEKHAEGRKTDWEESKQRSADNAAKEAASKGQSFKDSDDLLSSTTQMYSYRTHGGEVISRDLVLNRKNRGRIDRFVDTAKEYIKDRFGYDEKEAYEKAKEEHNLASLQAAVARSNAEDARKYRDMVNRDGYSDAVKERANSEYREYSDATYKTTAKYLDAKKQRESAESEYFNTPIGRLEKTYNTGKDWLEKLFGKKR